MHKGNGHGAVSVKGLFSSQHFIHHYAYGINIASLVRNISPCLFRTDIMNGAYRLFGHCLVSLSVKAGNAEIHDLYCAVR